MNKRSLFCTSGHFYCLSVSPFSFLRLKAGLNGKEEGLFFLPLFSRIKSDKHEKRREKLDLAGFIMLRDHICSRGADSLAVL